MYNIEYGRISAQLRPVSPNVRNFIHPTNFLNMQKTLCKKIIY